MPPPSFLDLHTAPSDTIPSTLTTPTTILLAQDGRSISGFSHELPDPSPSKSESLAMATTSTPSNINSKTREAGMPSTSTPSNTLSQINESDPSIPENEYGRPEHPGPAATDVELEIYKRALAEWEDSNGFIKRYAERQKDGKLLSVNDSEYKELVADFRMRQRISTRSVGCGDAVEEEEEERRKGRTRRGGLKKSLLRLLKS
ncbi:hypothetical protein DL98DRAFT_590142 [Cadophora sp. DSE1049]|nr:hypothetical protein DL98DRAFT_590142 [Cadophora sp. DSE1049]